MRVLILLLFFLMQTSGQVRAEGKIRVNDPVLLQAQVGYAGLDWLQERRLGDSFAKTLYKAPRFIQDAVLQEFIARLAGRLQAGAVRIGAITTDASARMAWQWLLFKDPSINAFATPGGYVGINLGLIAHSRTEDEVASVLAHELSHVTQRHLARLLAKQEQQTPLLWASILLSGLAAGSNPDLASAVLASGAGLGIQNTLNFSRDMESEADRIGFNVLVASGYSGLGFQTFFEKLQSVNRINDQGEYPYLRTHPLTSERIADIANRVQSQPLQNTAATLDYAFLVARAGVLSTDSDNLRLAQQTPKNAAFAHREADQQATSLYAAALAAMLLRDEQAAQDYARDLQKNTAVHSKGAEAAERLARLLQAEVDLAFGRTQAAQEALEPLPIFLPRPELLLLVQAQVQQGAVSLTRLSDLQKLVVRNPKDAAAWQWLGKVYTLQNKPLRALEAQAQASAAQLDYDGAVGRLLAAQDRLLARTEVAELNAQERVQEAILDSLLKQYMAARRKQRKFEAAH